MLLHEKDSEPVVKKVEERLRSGSFTRSELRTYLSFLLNAGRYQECYQLFLKWFGEEKKILWRIFFWILHRSGFKPGRPFMDQLFRANVKLGDQDQIPRYAPWDDLDPRMREVSEQHYSALTRRQKSRREELYEKLEYVRAQRMIEQEEKLLDALEALDPADPILPQARKEFRERWARHVIAEKSRALFDEEFFEAELPLTEEEKTWTHQFGQLVEEIVIARPALAYDMSIGFYFLELFNHALRFLRFADESLATDWLRLELMLKARRFIECLDDLQRVETKYADDPESTFAATYFRALILRGLGQTGAAIELLKSIVSIRPHYRSAHALLLDWSGGHLA